MVLHQGKETLKKQFLLFLLELSIGSGTRANSVWLKT